MKLTIIKLNSRNSSFDGNSIKIVKFKSKFVIYVLSFRTYKNRSRKRNRNCRMVWKVQTFVSLHEKVKLVVIPMTETNCLLVLTVLPSANTEYIASKINLLMIGYKQDNGLEDHKQFSIGPRTKGARRRKSQFLRYSPISSPKSDVN